MDTVDPPPSYTDAIQLTEQLVPGCVSFNPQNGQVFPLRGRMPEYSPAVPGYDAVAYYPSLSSTATSVLILQPQPHRRPVVTVTQSQQTDDVVDANKKRWNGFSFCLCCCTCVCLCGPCVLLSFMS